MVATRHGPASVVERFAEDAHERRHLGRIKTIGPGVALAHACGDILPRLSALSRQHELLHAPIVRVGHPLDEVPFLETVGKAGDVRRIARQTLGQHAHRQGLVQFPERRRQRHTHAALGKAVSDHAPHPGTHLLHQQHQLGGGWISHGSTIILVSVNT